MASNEVRLDELLTPRTGGSLILGPVVSDLAARMGVRVLSRPMKLGRTVVAARHAHVTEVLRRDLDFRIAPINGDRIEAVNGGFLLGTDRSDRLNTERRALYAALDAVDLADLMAKAADDADQSLAEASETIDAVGGYARLVAGRTAQRLFGIRGSDDAYFLAVARAIFAHTFLNLGGDKAVEGRALKAAGLLKSWLEREIARRRAAGVTGDDLMGALMRQPALDDDWVRRILGGMLVGSIDTTATAVAKVLSIMGRDPRLLAAAERDAHDLPLTLGWCHEALRRWPHNPILLRQAAGPTDIDGVAVPAGARVIAWTQAAMQDAQAFPDPRASRPDRDQGAYLHFGGGLHPCAGRAVNDRQIPMLVARLLARGVRKVGRIEWAGPFPDRLPVQLRRPS